MKKLRKLQYKFTLGAIAFAAISMFATKILIEHYYDYQLPNWFYLIGAINILTFSVYVLIINKLFKIERQKLVALTAFFALVVQSVLSYFLIPLYYLNGAILIYFSGQLLETFIFFILDRKLTNPNKDE